MSEDWSPIYISDEVKEKLLCAYDRKAKILLEIGVASESTLKIGREFIIAHPAKFRAGILRFLEGYLELDLLKSLELHDEYCP